MSIEDIRQFHALCKQESDQVIQARLDILLKQQKQALEELEHAKKRVEYLNHKVEKEFLNTLFQIIRIQTKRITPTMSNPFFHFTF